MRHRAEPGSPSGRSWRHRPRGWTDRAGRYRGPRRPCRPAASRICRPSAKNGALPLVPVLGLIHHVVEHHHRRLARRLARATPRQMPASRRTNQGEDDQDIFQHDLLPWACRCMQGLLRSDHYSSSASTFTAPRSFQELLRLHRVILPIARIRSSGRTRCRWLWQSSSA